MAKGSTAIRELLLEESGDLRMVWKQYGEITAYIDILKDGKTIHSLYAGKSGTGYTKDNFYEAWEKSGEKWDELTGKKVSKEMSKGKEKSTFAYYMDWEEIDAHTPDARMIHYVMREMPGSDRTKDLAVFNSQSSSEALQKLDEILSQPWSVRADLPYSLSLLPTKDGKAYFVTGKGFTSTHGYTEEGLKRARALVDNLNKAHREAKAAEKSLLPAKKETYMGHEWDEMPSGETDAYYLNNYSGGKGYFSTVSKPKPKPVKESTLRSLRSFMENVGGTPKYAALFAYCQLSEVDLTKHLIEKCGMKDISKHPLIETLLPTGDLLWKKGKESTRKDKKRVLAVAHRDTVITHAKHEQYVSHWEGKDFNDSLNDVLISSCFDDRIGVFTILHMLPKLGIDVDILFTTDEERGASTAEWFSMDIAKDLTGYKGEGSPYSHIVEFDRRGEDVVAYQYEDNSASWTELEKEMTKAGMVIGQGSFTDICYLSHLSTKAINVGMGTMDEHARKSYLEVREYLSNLLRYARLYHNIKREEMVFPHEDKGGKRSSVVAYGSAKPWTKEERDAWDKGVQERKAKRREERKEVVLSETNNPEALRISLTGLPKKKFKDTNSLTMDMKYVANCSLYMDETTGEVYLNVIGGDYLFLVEGGDALNGKGKQ